MQYAFTREMHRTQKKLKEKKVLSLFYFKGDFFFGGAGILFSLQEKSSNDLIARKHASGRRCGNLSSPKPYPEIFL